MGTGSFEGPGVPRRACVWRRGRAGRKRPPFKRCTVQAAFAAHRAPHLASYQNLPRQVLPDRLALLAAVQQEEQGRLQEARALWLLRRGGAVLPRGVLELRRRQDHEQRQPPPVGGAGGLRRPPNHVLVALGCRSPPVPAVFGAEPRGSLVAGRGAFPGRLRRVAHPLRRLILFFHPICNKRNAPGAPRHGPGPRPREPRPRPSHTPPHSGWAAARRPGPRSARNER